ncbi:MAG: glycoside hydrolase family 57 protein [Bryobacteraceae bacterium]
MPRIYLCFVWHMHQPYYKDLVSGQYRMPWTRLHAIKDYYGMARVLEEFPGVHQTFNLAPSMMAQVDEYARGAAADPFLAVALKPAEALSETEQTFLLRNSFNANPERMIGRYPRYGELFGLWQAAQSDPERARRSFGVQAYRDLQVLSQVAWFDEDFLEHDSGVRKLVEKGRNFTHADQDLMGAKQTEILGLVLPAYRRLAESGQIEISTTPYYHPILPLLCDSNIAAVSHPHVPVPSRFRYPEDAREQLERARAYVSSELGYSPAGLWPSEGSVSDEALALAADAGFRWSATDSGVLDRTLGRAAGIEGLYRPYRWERDGRAMHMIFRDHFLSDLIGFVYSKMDAAEAAANFLHRVRENSRAILDAGRDALVPIILDGENAWEYYDRNGRPFLRELYRLLSEDEGITAATVSEALAQAPAEPLDHIFPGSWINANFDVWIGAEEDNKAWEHLLRARQAYEQSTGVAAERRKLAYEELLIAEGSDWCWWYGPEHHSTQRAEFDQLYRDHLANVYRALELAPPEELSRPIVKSAVRVVTAGPTGLIHPVLDGEVTSYFEWLGAGLYKTDERTGAMHGARFLVREAHFGADRTHLFLRLDFCEVDLTGAEMRMRVESAADPSSAGTLTLRFRGGELAVVEARGIEVDCVLRRVLEIGVALGPIGAAGRPVRFQFSMWQDGLPMDAVPQHGWLEVSTSASEEWIG